MANQKIAAWLEAQEGELVLLETKFQKIRLENAGLPDRLRRFLEERLRLGEGLVAPKDGFRYPAGVLVATRDREGLWGWTADVSGQRLEGLEKVVLEAEPDEAEPSKAKASKAKTKKAAKDPGPVDLDDLGDADPSV